MPGKTTTYRRPSVSIGMGFDGADYSWMTNEKENTTGFFITFNVPFKRDDVFKELLSDDGQLGSEPGNSSKDGGPEYRILRPGRQEGKLVRPPPPPSRPPPRRPKTGGPHFGAWAPAKLRAPPSPARRFRRVACARRCTGRRSGDGPSPSCVRSR